MANILATPKLDVEIRLKINEEELRALEAMCGYGITQFIDCFYKNMGTTYMKPHEQGMRTFMEAIKGEAPKILRQLEEARKAFIK